MTELKKKIYLAKNLDDLQLQADKLPQLQFTELAICNRILKLYDEAMKLLNVENEGGKSEPADEELAYVYLWRFVQLCLKISKSKIYQKDATYVDSLLSKKKQAKAMKLLERLQVDLNSRYEKENGGVGIDTLKIEENDDVKSLPTQEAAALSEEIQQILDKLYINSKDLVKLIERSTLNLLIVDCRSRTEHDSAHIDFSYLVKASAEHRLLDYVNLNADFIASGLVLWKLEEKARSERDQELLEALDKRAKYDYLILFDSKSRSSDLNAVDNKLLVLKRALCEFDQSKTKCRNEPLVLDGGWLDWIMYYPAYKKRNERTVLVEEEKKTEAVIQHPVIAVEDEETKFTKNMSDSEEDNESVPMVPKVIPRVDRSVKPSIKPVEPPKAPKIIPQPQTILPTPPVQTAPVFQRPNFLNQIYKPTTENIYFVKPIKTSSVMNGGITKYLNPMTGTLEYVYDEGKQIQYTPNDMIPQVVLNRPSVTTAAADPLVNNRPAVNKPQVPDRSKKAPLLGPKPVQASLKRTYSSPNIEELSEDEDQRPQIRDSSSSEEDTPISTVAPTPVASAPVTPAPVTPNVAASVIINSAQKPTPAAKLPEVKRENKPMPDHIKKMRLEELDPQWSNVHPGLTGIRNLGNTCFMNSILQCLNNTKQLKEYFLSETYRNDLNRTNQLGFGGEIADEFSIICHALWWGHCKTISPRRFKALIGQFNSQFIANDQQDAQEFLLFLLDGLHEDLNKVQERPRNLPEIDYDNLDDNDGAYKAWEHHKKLNNSIIVDLFQGMFRSIVACLHCGKQSVKFDAFMYLTLPILQSRCSLYECLSLFLKPEKMEGESKWKCPNCKTYRVAAKKIDIWSLPRLLIIHLKRFKYQGMWRDKIKTVVDYPIDNLDLTKFVLKTNMTAKQKLSFNLFAISNHTGTLDGGHYTALCKNEKLNRWFKYDDSTVKEADVDSIRSAPSSYILFYSSTA